MTALLTLESLEKTYQHDLFKKPQKALKGLNLTLNANECIGLMGHNGAGKTTTIRMIFGMIRPDRGRVLFEGRAMKRDDRRRIGYMPETNKLALTLTPEEILRHQLRVFGLGWGQKKKIAAKLEEVGLLDARRKKVNALSKGMARRLAWAQATIHEPDLIILDEPFSGLDPLGREDMLGWMKDLKRRERSMLICTHEFWALAALCDDVSILNQGELVYSGKPSNRYVLQISGGDEAGLAKLRDDLRLPAWNKLQCEGFLAKMRFDSYPNAERWLSACLSKGLVVVRFQDVKGYEPEDLLPYFAKGAR